MGQPEAASASHLEIDEPVALRCVEQVSPPSLDPGVDVKRHDAAIFREKVWAGPTLGFVFRILLGVSSLNYIAFWTVLATGPSSPVAHAPGLEGHLSSRHGMAPPRAVPLPVRVQSR